MITKGFRLAHGLPCPQAGDSAMDSLEGVVLSDGAAFTEGLAQIFIVAQLR